MKELQDIVDGQVDETKGDTSIAATLTASDG